MRRIHIMAGTEELARMAAAIAWTYHAFRGLDYLDSRTFIRDYPDRDKYVDEWWEERYLPMVGEWIAGDLRKPEPHVMEAILRRN